jgi:hypothetical protein
MPALIAFLMRLLALVAGLVVAAGVLFAGFIGAVLFLLHSGWVRLGGRPVWSFLLAAGRRGWGSSADRMRPAPGFVPQRVRVPVRDVTDVEPK